MPVLNANTAVALGPYAKGAILTITAPQTDTIADFPDLNGTYISLTYLPKKITLAQNTAYTLTAAAANITYQVQQ
ncbi:hypothetical protein KFE98_17285 [bacterium SCSIO 12741]|nr:hypothetical protein KFE98_17285 [bacterium SCSIO 12741]